jgi:cysteine-rich repeat protein
MRLLGLCFLATSLAVAFGGCAKGESYPDDDCTPNDRKACSCSDGAKGWQLCLKSRTYEPCACAGSNLNEAPPAPSCGNGRVEPGETCDDRNGANNDGCNALCQWGDGPEGRDGCAGLRPLPIGAGEALEGRQALSETTGGGRGSCGGDGEGAELAYAFVPRASGTLELTLRPEASSLDVVLYVRRGACSDEGSELDGGCRNEAGGGGEERLNLPVEEGTAYYVFADALGPGEVTLFARLGEGPSGGGCEGEGLDCATGFGGDCEAGRLTCFENKYLVCRPLDGSCD